MRKLPFSNHLECPFTTLPPPCENSIKLQWMCSEGTYNRDDVCNKCSFGFYQDESQQTACKACPDGFKTVGTGSKSRQECST